MRSEDEINRAVELYADMIRRICLYHLKNEADTEDVFQNVFVKYLLYDGEFENKEHEKAWFIRVSINACKDYLKRIFYRQEMPLDVLAEVGVDMESEKCKILEAVLSLPVKYKDVIYLHYYEGYSAIEIAGIMQSKENTVYSLLSRGRAMLRKKLGGDEFEQ